MSSFLFGGSSAATSSEGPSAPPAASAPPAVPPRPPGTAPAGNGAPQRNQTLTVIAGVGVLLLAMGVGVLIGRAGSPKQAAAPTQVISVAQPSGSAGTGASTEASFTSDWPSGTSGYTVQLQTLPQSGTTASAVESAKSAAGAKGAKAVGALKSEEFTSLPSGDYVIYSGVYHKRAEAEKALAGLRKSFAAAKVIKVSNGGSGSSGASSGASSAGGGGGGTPTQPAPASTLEDLKGAKGKNYEEKSKNLPNVVETG